MKWKFSKSDETLPLGKLLIQGEIGFKQSSQSWAIQDFEIDLVAGVTGSPTKDAKPCCSSCHNQHHCRGPMSGVLIFGGMCNSSYMGLLTSSVHLRVLNWLLKDSHIQSETDGKEDRKLLCVDNM